MNTLAIDSSCEILSIALETSSGVFYTEINAGLRHSELLAESVDALCKTAELSPPELNAVVCAKGPGSFTGLRIGFSAAKGLCAALEIPLVAISTLDCMAYPLSVWPGIVLPAIDAKKSSFFTAAYREGSRITGYLDADPQTIIHTLEKTGFSNEPVILTGPGAKMLHPLLAKLLPSRHITVNPLFQGGIARELLETAKCSIVKGVNNINSGPDYIRKSDAELTSNI